MKLRLPGILLSAVLACTCAVAAVENPADGGVTNTGSNYFLSQEVTLTQSYDYTGAGAGTVLSVGTLYGEGVLNITGATTAVNIGNSLHIGGWGWGSGFDKTTDTAHDGTVYVTGGATLDVPSQLNIGAGGPVTGTLVVDGGTVKVGHGLNVGLGEGATGILEIKNGGTVLVEGPTTEPATSEGWSAVTVGFYTGTTGKILIDGVGSSLTTTGYTKVWLGQLEGTSSEIRVTNGAELTMGDTYVGMGGEGNIIADSAAKVTINGNLNVSVSPDPEVTSTDAGSVQISGAGTTITVNGNVFAGNTGQGDIAISDGAKLTANYLVVSGQEGGTSGQVTLDGAGSTLEVKNDVFVADGEGAAGAVELANGATVDIDGALYVGRQVGDSAGSFKVDNDSTLHVTGGGEVGSGSNLTVGSGSSVKSDADLTFLEGGQLVFNVTDGDAGSAPVVDVGGGSVNFAQGSKLVYNLDKTLANSETGEFTLPFIIGDVTSVGQPGEMPTTEVYGPDGSKMEGDATTLKDLGGGRYGLEVRIEQQAANNVLAPDAQRLVNTLWSSTGVVQEYGEAVLAHLNRPGSKNVWAMGLGSFQRMSSFGAATGYHYNGGGYAVGADTAITENFNAGVSVGQMHGRHKAADGLSNVRQNSLMASLYGRYDLGRNKCGTHIMVDGYMGYGHTRNRARSWSDTNDEMITGRWGDDVFAFGIKGTWQRKLTDNSTIASFVGMRYLYGMQDDITMASANSSRDYYDGSMQNLSIPVGVTLRYYYAVGSKGVISPSLTVGYIADVFRRNPSLRTKVLGNCTKFEGSDPGRHAFMLRAGLGYQIDEQWYVGAGYNLEARSSDLEQGIDVSVSYSF